MKMQFDTDHTESRFCDDVLDCLTDSYTLDTGEVVNGIAESHLPKRLRGGFGASDLPSGRRWRNVSRAGSLADTLIDMGFRIAPARNARNQRVNVVTL